MKKVAVVTATRAEYGLLSPVIKELRKYENDSLKVELIVTGTHLSDEYSSGTCFLLSYDVRFYRKL